MSVVLQRNEKSLSFWVAPDTHPAQGSRPGFVLWYLLTLLLSYFTCISATPHFHLMNKKCLNFEIFFKLENFNNSTKMFFEKLKMSFFFAKSLKLFKKFSKFWNFSVSVRTPLAITKMFWSIFTKYLPNVCTFSRFSEPWFFQIHPKIAYHYAVYGQTLYFCIYFDYFQIFSQKNNFFSNFWISYKNYRVQFWLARYNGNYACLCQVRWAQSFKLNFTGYLSFKLNFATIF